MNGAESLLRSLIASAVNVCFANPGTSEMHFVAALDRVPEMRAVLCLFEGVATGAADGYGRISGRPAATLLHLGPGLANGLANLHNARRAGSPVVNLVGDHATYHARFDTPLASDIVGFARPVSHWIRSSADARSIGSDVAQAVQAARSPPGRIATLILPADVAWLPSTDPAAPLAVDPPKPVADVTLNAVAEALRGTPRSALLLRGEILGRHGLENAGRVADAVNCRLLCDTFAPKLEVGAGIVQVERVPYFAEQIVEFLRDVDLLVLVGGREPVAFFAYPDKPSWCLRDSCRVVSLARSDEDGVGALADIARRLDAPRVAHRRAGFEVAAPPTEGKFNAFTIGRVIGHYLPEGAIVSDDGATSSAAVLSTLRCARPHVHLPLTGGAIGQGMPVAIGAAVARPESKVICLSGDGSGLYTPQALWTMARENLDITVVVFANRAYKILNVELGRVGAGNGGPQAAAMVSLRDPPIGWARLARGFGVEGVETRTISEFATAFADAMSGRRPRLIEAVLE